MSEATDGEHIYKDGEFTLHVEGKLGKVVYSDGEGWLWSL